MPRASRQPPSELPPGKLGAVSAELALAGRNGLSRSKPKAGAPPDGGSNVTAGRIVAPHAELGYGISARTPKTEILVFVFLPLAELAAVVGKVPVRVWILAGISVLAIPRWSGYSNPRLGCKVFVFLSRSMLRSLPFGSLNAARSPRSSSLEGFSPIKPGYAGFSGATAARSEAQVGNLRSPDRSSGLGVQDSARNKPFRRLRLQQGGGDPS